MGLVKGGPQLVEKYPTTPWGCPVLGRRSRKMNKYSDNLIFRCAVVNRKENKIEFYLVEMLFNRTLALVIKFIKNK